MHQRTRKHGNECVWGVWGVCVCVCVCVREREREIDESVCASPQLKRLTVGSPPLVFINDGDSMQVSSLEGDGVKQLRDTIIQVRSRFFCCRIVCAAISSRAVDNVALWLAGYQEFAVVRGGLAGEFCEDEAQDH